jgi:D-sedoheptulose 7-phosphate isomerase
MVVVALTGRDAGALAGLLRETDILISVPHERAARVREVHALVLNCLCDGVDSQLFGEQENP